MQISSCRPIRKPNRLANYDYSLAGAYFVTLCSQGKRCIFGLVVENDVVLSPAGEIVRAIWMALPERFPRLVLDEFVIMPNHLHGVLGLVGAGLAPPLVAPPGPQLGEPRFATTQSSFREQKYSLSSVIGAFKSITTIQVNKLLSRKGEQLWQRSYHDHIIRKGEDLRKIQRYINENPLIWSLDPENPNRKHR